jgi:peptide/nickel transport system substrate-binding protein
MTFARKSAVAWVAVAALATLTACGPGAPSGDEGFTKTTLTLGNTLEPTSWDTAAAQEGNHMQYYQAVYDTLLLRAPNGDIEPMLATEWSYDDSATELTLDLRTDVTFADGVAFDADAAKANLDYFRGATGPQTSTMARVSSVDVVDDDTITITLTEPEPSLLVYLTNAAGLMASPELLGTEELKTGPIGSGPYTLDADETVIGSQYTFVAREDYWNPDLQHFETVVIKPMTDAAARLNALISGQADALLLEPKQAEQADGAGLVQHFQSINWQGLMLWDRDGVLTPALADVRVRQAINHAIDGDGILREVAAGFGESTTQVFGPNSIAYDESLDDAYEYDPEKAAELLEEAGYADGFSMRFVTSSRLDPAMIAVVVEQLGAVGITAEVQEVQPADFIGTITSGDYSFSWMQLFQPSAWGTANQLLAPDALWNPFGTEDVTVADLMEDLQFGDDETATSAARELNAYIVEQAWFAPWYRPQLTYYSNDSINVEVQVEQAAPSIYNYTPAE